MSLSLPLRHPPSQFNPTSSCLDHPVTMRSPHAAAGRLVCRSTWPLVAAPARQGIPFLPLHASRRANSSLVDRPIPPPFRPPPPPAAADNTVRQEDNGEAAARRIFLDAIAAEAPRRDWTKKEIASIYYQPLMELAYQAVST